MQDIRNPDTLGDNEVDLLFRIIREAYSDTLATDTWTRILGMIDGLVAYDVGGAVFANLQTGRLENRIWGKRHKADAEFCQWHDDNYGALSVIAGLAVSRGLSIWRPSDVIGKKEWEACKIRNDFLNDFGLGELLCTTCGSAHEISARFALIREADKTDFSERDRFVLGLLQPHFSTALRLAKTLRQDDIYRESWQQTRTPRFVLDASANITDMNAKARELAGDGDGEDYLAQVQAIARNMIASRSALQNVEFAGRKHRFWLSEVVFPNAPTTYVLAIDTGSTILNLTRQSAIETGCSEREVEVCMMMAQGASNREIADNLFIAEATVKDHVASIFEKLEVTKRSAVVPRLLGI